MFLSGGRIAEEGHCNQLRTSRNKASGTPLNRGLFTAFISKNCEDEIEWRPGQCLFEAPGELGLLIREALEKSPTQKAPGEGEIKTEMLKVDSQLSTEIIIELWNACGRCGELPAHWQTALPVPIHEKDRLNDPSNHRPISLLGQVRKIVDKTIDMIIGNPTHSTN